MTFNPQTVFGLCNVLNRHSKSINLNISLDNSSQYQIEQWAKRMDLIYRDSSAKWDLIFKEPLQSINNLKLIEALSNSLISALYEVHPAVQKQLARSLPDGGFVKFRSQIREQLYSIKNPIDEVVSLFEDEPIPLAAVKPVAAVEAIMDVWKAAQRDIKIPKVLKTNNALNNFTGDCLKIFEVDDDAKDAYRTWYRLTQK